MNNRFSAATLARAIITLSTFALTASAQQQQIFWDGFEGVNSCQVQYQSAPCPGWIVTTPGGAQGTGQIVNTIAVPGGNYSYQIQKTNSVGYIDVALNLSPGLTLQPGHTYTFHMSYHSSNAPLSSMLLIRLLNPSADPTNPTDPVNTHLGYDATADGSEGYESQALIRNSTAAWFDRVMDTKLQTTDQPRTVWPHVVLYGNPSTVYIDNFEIVEDNSGFSWPAGPPFQSLYSPQQVTTILSGRPEATAARGTYNGHPVLTVNGAPVPPLLYKALGSAASIGDYKGFHDAGVDTVIMAAPLNFGPGQSLPSSPSWIDMNGAEPVMDFSSLDANVMALLQKNPNANIILDLWVYPNQTWLTNNKKSDTFLIPDNPPATQGPWPSDGSLSWRSAASAAIADLVSYVRNRPYHTAVMGYFLTAGIDGQETQLVDNFDNSTANTLAFQAWLQNTYKTIGALNQAWQLTGTAAYQNFGAISVPAPYVNQPDPTPTITGPSARTSFLAFRRQQSWALRDAWASVIKANAGKPVVVLTYAEPRDQGFVQSQYIDGAGMQPPYQFRSSGLPDGFKPISPDSLHGKLLFSELDLRSWVDASGSELDSQWTPIPGLGDFNEWKQENRKLIGGALADGFGAWYYDMDQYFNDPNIMAEIGLAVQTWKEALAAPKSSFRPDVCVVIADDAFDYVTGLQSPLDGAALGLMQLQTSGVPFDVQYLSDVVSNPQLPQYKVYVFWHLARLTTTERTAIANFSHTAQVLIWEYDTGLVSDSGIDLGAMEWSIGMNIATSDTYLRGTPLLLGNIAKDGLLPFQSMYELELSKFWLDQTSTDNIAGSLLSLPRQFSVNDSQATPLATFNENGTVAIARKRLGTAFSYYIASPYGLGGDMLSELAAGAGAYVVGVPGPAIHMNGEFMSLHAMASGPYTIALPPGKHIVRDAITGTVLSKGYTHYTFQTQPQTTYWLSFQ
jgi:hypothetical protein